MRINKCNVCFVCVAASFRSYQLHMDASIWRWAAISFSQIEAYRSSQLRSYGASCIQLVAFLLHRSVDIGGQVDLTYMDFMKAFDLVPHRRLSVVFLFSQSVKIVQSIQWAQSKTCFYSVSQLIFTSQVSRSVSQLKADWNDWNLSMFWFCFLLWLNLIHISFFDIGFLFWYIKIKIILTFFKSYFISYVSFVSLT